MVVLDTSALLFWTLHRERLSAAASAAIAEAERILVSSISIWEIGIKVGRGGLSIPIPVREYAERLEQLIGVEVLPVDMETWLINLELQWEHQDSADRTIVATAVLNSCPLVTSDRTIRSFYSRSIW